MLVILFIMFQGEPAPNEVASVISRPLCEAIAQQLNKGAEKGVKFGCYERKPTVQG